jgi:Tn3 transposase DDE domain
MRFVVPIRTVYSGPNPKYFGQLRGMTWYNLLSDRFTGLNAIPVPGTMRDSLVLLAVVLEQQTEMKPTRIMVKFQQRNAKSHRAVWCFSMSMPGLALVRNSSIGAAHQIPSACAASYEPWSPIPTTVVGSAPALRRLTPKID